MIEVDRSLPWHSPWSLWWLAIVSLSLYAGLRILLPEVGQVSGTLMAVTGLVAVLGWGRRLRASGPLWLLLGVIVVQVISWVAGYLHHPHWMTDNPEVDRLAKWFLFIGIAWWLGGSTRYTLVAWSLGLAGFLATVALSDGGLAGWLRGLDGRRVDFGIRNAQHTAMFFAAGLLGLLCFARRALGAGRWCWPRRIGWAALTLLCLVGVGITQTRAVWLALSVVAVAMGGLALLHGMLSRRAVRSWKPWMAGAGVLCMVLVGAGWGFKGIIENRLAAENAVIAQALEDDWKEIPYSSVGNRLVSWRAAVDWIAERPLVGWGEEGRSLVVQETDWLPDETRNNYGHLHNTFLELLVSYGALGVAVMAALATWIGVGAWRAWRGGVLPTDMAVFGAAFFVFYLVINQFESYGFFWTGVYLQNLVLGGLVTHIWRWQVESGQSVIRFPGHGGD